MRSLSSEMITSSGAGIVAAREKCSRNKRKFRQDPPCPITHGSRDENNVCAGGNGNAGVSSEGENNWMPESSIPGSVEVVTSSKNSGSCIPTDSSSSRKGSDSGGKTISNSTINNSKSETTTTSSRSFHQDQVKLMRFRSGQATRVGKPGGTGAAGWDGKQLTEDSSAGADGHNNIINNGNRALEEGSNEFYEPEEEEWDDAESELEDLLVKNLSSIYNDAIKKIVASGHSAEEALTAVLEHGRCCGGKDTVSDIVENALAYLTGKSQPCTGAPSPTPGDDGGSSPGNHRSFCDLTDLHKYSLAQMVGLLRELRPSLSKVDAMWRLLMSDMNVKTASVMDDSALSSPAHREQQQAVPEGSPRPTNNLSSSGQAGARVVGSSASPTTATTTLPPPNCDSNSTLPTSSTPVHASKIPPRSSHPAPTSAAATVAKSPLLSAVPSPPISDSPAGTIPSTLPLQNPSSVSSSPDLPLLVPIPLKSDETSSNFEELSTDKEGTAEKVTNIAEPGDDDCTSSELDDDEDEQEQEQEQDETVEGLTYSAIMPAIASLKLDERVDQKQPGSTSESDEDGNILQRSSVEICEPLEKSSQATDDDILTAIKEEENDLDFSLSKERTASQAELLQVAELHIAATDGVVSSAETQPWDSSVNPPQPGNFETTGMISSQEENSSISVQPPEATCSVAEPLPREAMSCPIVQFGTVDEPPPAATAAVEKVSSSRVSQATSDGDITTTSTSTSVDGNAIARCIQVAQKTDTAAVTKETTTTTTTVSSPEAAPECLSGSNETTTSVSGKGQVEEEKDEMIMKLVHRSKELETQLQERTEWAKQKVMQAARRLSNDLQELKELRRERDEALHLKKDKQALEDSAKNKLSDLETALRKANSQLDETVKKLDAENAEIRAEMQAAKLSAAESQSSCQEMAKRERKSTKRGQAWEKQKAKLQEDLSEEKRKIVSLQQQLVLAKERQQQAEVRWRQEEKAKEESLLRADHERRTKEQAETAAKKREESLRRKAESNYQRHREDIQRLESEISQFRTTAEAAQLATSRWGPGVAVTPNMMELSSLKESKNRLVREIAELQDMARRDVHRERECVMCMCEEMSVVFLPCAHQVVCVKCNDLHEKQGMRDCPSCRTPIKQRIRVYGVST